MAGASMSSARDEHKVLACLDPAYDPMCVWRGVHGAQCRGW